MALYTGNIKFTATDTEPTEDKGRIYYDDSESQLKHYDGSNWGNVSRDLTYGVTPGYGPYTVDDYTKLLIHSDTSDGSTTFVDSSTGGHTISVNGTAAHQDTQKKIGNTSIYLPSGIANYIGTGRHADFQFTTGDFTFDFWCHSLTGYPFSGYDGSHGGHNLYGNDAGYFNVNSSSGSAGLQGSSLAGSSWSHVALVRSGNTMYLFINGILAESEAFTYSIDATGEYRFGRNGTDNSDGTGYFDEIRISKGVARWTSDFTVY